MILNKKEKLLESIVNTVLLTVGYNITQDNYLSSDVIRNTSFDKYSSNMKMNINLLLDTENVVSFNVKDLDFGIGYSGKKANLMCDLLFIFDINNDSTIESVKVNIEKISPNEIYDIYILDFFGSFVSYLQVAFNELRDIISGFYLKDNNKFQMFLDDEMFVVLEVLDMDKFSLSNMNFDFYIMYEIDINKSVIDEISSWSNKLKRNIKKLIDNNGVWINDIYKIVGVSSTIDMNKFTKTFNNKYRTKELYKNSDLMKSFAENRIYRTKKCSLLDALILYEKSGVNFKSISYIL